MTYSAKKYQICLILVCTTGWNIRLKFVWNNVIEKYKLDWNAELEIKFIYSKKVMSFLSLYVYIQFDYLSMKQM